MARPTPSRPDLRRPAPRPRKWADVALRVAVVPDRQLAGHALARRLPRRALAAAAIFIALFGGYVALNFAVGGRWLPETVSAKAALAGA